MSSASKTANLGLPQWADTEKPTKLDFNDAFLKIDAASQKYKVSTQNHAANTMETQTVTLGFRPKLVRIKAVFSVTNGGTYDSNGASDGATQSCVYCFGDSTVAPDTNTVYIVMMHSGSGADNARITFTSTGFTLTWAHVGTALPAGMIKMLITAVG